MESAIYTLPEPFCGSVRIECSDGRLLRLELLTSDALGVAYESTESTDSIYKKILEYLNGARCCFDIEVDLSGCTPFQRKVLAELQRIPYGQTRSYKDIAVVIGNPNAARAVGLACNRNPIHIVIPCHRVVGAQGKLVGYAAGISTKQRLLQLERSV
ncbi:MAG: methylated-DNA--[protein]-cysteine S-methyltransferase [Rikenellaceae bacterium]